MGFRSQVIILCENKAFEEIKNLYRELSYADTIKYYSGNGKETPYYYIEYEYVKWRYSDFGIGITNKLCSLNNIDGYGFKIIDIGDDYSTIESANDIGENRFYDYYVIAEIHRSEEYNQLKPIKTLIPTISPIIEIEQNNNTYPVTPIYNRMEWLDEILEDLEKEFGSKYLNINIMISNSPSSSYY
jgi:hypothetical protein